MMKLRIPIALACLLAAGMAPAENAVDIQAGRLVTRQGELRPLDEEYRALVEQAVDTLAQARDVSAAEISVDTVREVDWRDSSLGCPEPGRAYAQVITSGHRISLRAEGRLYFVHEAGGRMFVCEAAPVAGVSPAGELAWGRAVQQARGDLSRRIGAAPAEIRIAGVRARSWENASLGCPAAGVDYPAVQVDGYVIRLFHRGREFTYHTDLARVFPCPPISAD